MSSSYRASVGLGRVLLLYVLVYYGFGLRV